MDVKITVVTTLYYSEPYLTEFYNRTKVVLNQISKDSEIIFVNDGSPDRCVQKVLELQRMDSTVVLIDLSRNFGHHQAIMTGLQHVSGDYIFLIDADLEEDPELLLTFFKTIQEDETIDVVYGVQNKRKGNFSERIMGSIFYKILNMLTKINYPANTLTARLMKRDYVTSVTKFEEKAIDIWAIFVLAGYNQKGVSVEKKNKGDSTYTFSKRLAMGVESITSFSHRPLYLIFFIGFIWLLISTINVIIILLKKWIFEVPIEGWSSIMASVWLIGGITIFLIGLIGIYLSKMFLEMKGRPLSIIKTIYRKHE